MERAQLDSFDPPETGVLQWQSLGEPNSRDRTPACAIESAQFGDGAGGRAFAQFIGLRRDAPGLTSLTIRPFLLNGAGLLLGPVGFALVDYSMASALWEHRSGDELIATINISLNFIQSATEGEIHCRSTLDRRNRYAATLSSRVEHDDGRVLITAIGSFAIRPSPAPTG